MPDDTHADLVLDRFWDALVDDLMADSDDLDPPAAASVRRLHAVASAPPPTASRERVRNRLNGLSGADQELAAPPTDHPMPLRSLRRNAAAANGHPTKPMARSLATPQAIHGARRWTAILATAAIILLALAAAIRSLGPGPLRDEGKAPAIPAPSGQPGVTAQTLVDVVLTPEELGFDGAFGTGLAYHSVPPGSHDSWPKSTGKTTEARVFYIVNGTLRVKGDLPLRVVRANGNGAVEQAPTDTWLTLNAGDALMRAPNVNLELENPGSESSYVLSWTLGGVLGIDGYPGYQPPDWQHINATWGYDGTRPNPPARFTLRHITLEQDATLTAPGGAYFQQYLDVAREHQSTLGVGSDHSISNRGSTTADLFVVALEPAAPTSKDAEAGAVPDETLLDVVLPEKQLRTPGRFNSIMGYYAVPAGSHDSWSGPTDSAPEPLVWHVLSGNYTVRAEQEVQIARAGENGKATLVAAGTESTLGPGDTMVRPAQAGMELSNSGKEPVLLVVWTLGDINVQGPSLPPSWESLPCYPGETSGTAPTGSSRLQLRLVTIAPNATLAAPPGAFVQQTLDLTQEAPNLGQKSDYSLVNQGTEPATLYVVSLEPVIPDGATPVSST